MLRLCFPADVGCLPCFSCRAVLFAVYVYLNATILVLSRPFQAPGGYFRKTKVLFIDTLILSIAKKRDMDYWQ